MWVKICGITRARDAELAVRLGADAIGFVFVPGSPRCVRPSEVRSMTRDLGILTVGIFANQDESVVRTTADEAALGAIQLHGSEPPELCARLDRPVIKAFRVTSPDSLERAKEYSVHAILADGPASGRSFDWSLARAHERVVVAGGLSAENVVRAIAMSNAFGVDVSSSIESAPGVKDPHLMRAFFEQVRT
jgi:phosphoribosylanthranilate isomerase